MKGRKFVKNQFKSGGIKDRSYLLKTKTFICIFLFLMVCAKGIGLDSEDYVYYVLTAVAVPVWILHIMSIRWEKKQLLFSLFLFSVALLVTMTTKRTGIILSVMAMIGVKDIDKDVIMRRISKLWICCVCVKLALAYGGIIEDKMVMQSGKVWHGMGYSSGNALHATVVILIILYLYTRKDKVRWSEASFLFALSCVIYKYSTSRSGFIMGSIAILLGCFLKVIARRKKMTKWLIRLLCMGMIAIVLLSFTVPLFYDGNYWGNNPAGILNRLLTGRIGHAHTVLTSDTVTLFGNSKNLSAFIDNAYVFLLMKYGIIMSAVICIVYIVAIKSMVHRGDVYGVYITFLFVLYGYTEQFFINSFMNYSFIIVGNEIFNVVMKRERMRGGSDKVC